MMSRGCRQIGRRETAALYLAGGVCGGLASTLLQRPYAEGVGASGAVYALEACNCMLHPHRLYVWGGTTLSAVQLLGARLALDVAAFAQGSAVDYSAHLGGAAAGVGYVHWGLAARPWRGWGW